MSGLATRTDLRLALAHVNAKLDNFALRLTIRFGVMLAAGIALLGALLKLT